MRGLGLIGAAFGSAASGPSAAASVPHREQDHGLPGVQHLEVDVVANAAKVHAAHSWALRDRPPDELGPLFEPRDQLGQVVVEGPRRFVSMLPPPPARLRDLRGSRRRDANRGDG